MSDSLEVKTAEVDGITMDYAVFGSGEKTFVMIPGLSIKSVLISASAVAESYKGFTKDYTVYLFDRRRNLPESYSVYEMADDTARVMNHIGLKDACIFGASQGGMIAQCIAIEYPELVSKLALGSTLSRANETSTRVITEWVTLAIDRKAEEFTKSTTTAMYSEATLEKYSSMFERMSRFITEEDFTRFEIIARGAGDFDVYDRLGEIRCPVLVLGAVNDKVVTGKASEEIAEKIGCEIYMYGEEYGHTVYDEAPDYRSRLLTFFEK